MKMKKYEIHARLPLTNQARNAGAIGRKFWWVLAEIVEAPSARAACAVHRKNGAFAYADKLKAVIR
jgi:hypothetical protein